MNIWESFVKLFQSANILTAALWVAGFVLFSIEFFQPMRKISYTVGVALLLTSFIMQMLHGSPGEAFIFVLLTCFVIFAVHVTSLAMQKRLWLSVSRLERAGERRRKYDSLIGSVGVANTPIDLTGNVTINDVNLVVYSESPIEAGESVRVTRVTSDKIMVECVEEDTDID